MVHVLKFEIFSTFQKKKHETNLHVIIIVRFYAGNCYKGICDFDFFFSLEFPLLSLKSPLPCVPLIILHKYEIYLFTPFESVSFLFKTHVCKII